LANDCRGIGPELVEVALDVPLRGRRRLAVALAQRKLPALTVEEHRLDDRVSGIEAKQEPGLRHGSRYPTLLRPTRPCGSWPSGRQRRGLGWRAGRCCGHRR